MAKNENLTIPHISKNMREFINITVGDEIGITTLVTSWAILTNKNKM